jgi:cell division protein FtsB
MKANNAVTKWLGIVVVLQALILLAVLFGGPSIRTAQAQIPDAGAQRDAMIEQLKASNEKLDKLLNLLSDGHLQVQVITPDESKAHGK